MGLLTTRWEAKFEGHNLTVNRNEVGRGFALEWNGTEIARRSWSWIGLGELHGTADVDGKHHDVKVAIEWAGFSELDGKCTITVDGRRSRSNTSADAATDFTGADEKPNVFSTASSRWYAMRA